MKFNTLLPELSVSDINASIEFYKLLGFVVMYERKASNFAFIQREESQLMLQQGGAEWFIEKPKYPFGGGVNFQIEIKGVKQLYEKVKDSVKIKKEAEFMMWVPYCDVVESNIEDKVLVQGVVDLIIEKENSIILVDYKFSKLPAKVLKDKYKEQYAINNGYGYLAIPYCEVDNGNYINLINEQILLLNNKLRWSNMCAS